MHCVIFVINPTAAFPKESTAKQLGFCRERGVPFFFVLTHASVSKAGQKEFCKSKINELLTRQKFTAAAEDITLELDNFTDYTDDDDCKAYNALLVLFFALANAQMYLKAGDPRLNFRKISSDEIFDPADSSSDNEKDASEHSE